jgi:hypothetical protein
MVTSRIWFTAAQKAELWERWKNGRSAAAISRALERKRSRPQHQKRTHVGLFGALPHELSFPARRGSSDTQGQVVARELDNRPFLIRVIPIRERAALHIKVSVVPAASTEYVPK